MTWDYLIAWPASLWRGKDTVVLIRICSYCHSKIGSGIRYECTKAIRLRNLDTSHSPGTNNQISAIHLRLIIRHRHMPFFLGLSCRKAHEFEAMLKNAAFLLPPLSHSLFSLITFYNAINANKLGFSNKQTLAVATMIREGAHSRKAVEATLVQKLISEGKRLMGHFSLKTLNVTVKSDERGQATFACKPVVVCSSISHFICVWVIQALA